MELCFFCPVVSASFLSASWEICGSLELETDRDGGKRLRGKVRAACPLCGGEHVYDPDELACPLSFRETGFDGMGNIKGGE
ncbi:hypothetical protein JCM14713_13010 [Desulfomicrobium salsuginis]